MNLFRWCILGTGILALAFLLLACNKAGDQSTTSSETVKSRWPPDTITVTYVRWPADTVSIRAGWVGAAKATDAAAKPFQYVAAGNAPHVTPEHMMKAQAPPVRTRMAQIETPQTMVLVRWPPDTTGHPAP